MARTRNLAPYPSPSPQLYDTQIPQLEDEDLRDGYDKQFRINQRLRRWGIEIADIINALDIGGWDPSTQVVWVGDGSDADYTNIAEAMESLSPSGHDPRVVVVFPGVYFDPFYIPSHTSIYGLGGRDAVKIWVECNSGASVIEGGAYEIALANLNIQQRDTSVTSTKVVNLEADGVRLKNVYIENQATGANNEVVVLDGFTTGKNKIFIEDAWLEGNNTVEDTDAFVEWTLEGNESFLWTGADIYGTVTQSFNDQSANNNDGIGDNYLTKETESPYAGGGHSIRYNNFGGNLYGDNEAGMTVDPDSYKKVTGEIYTKVAIIYSGRSNILHSARHVTNSGYVVRLADDSEVLFDFYLNAAYVTTVKTGYILDLNVWHILGYYIDTNATPHTLHFYVDGKLEGNFTFNTGGNLFGTGGVGTVSIRTGSDDNVLDSTYRGGDSASAILYIAQARWWGGDYRTQLLHNGEVASTSTLRIGCTATASPVDVQLRNVHVKNEKPTYNMAIGDIPVEMHGVHSRVASDMANANMFIRTTTDRAKCDLFDAVLVGGSKPFEIMTSGAKPMRLNPGTHFDRPLENIRDIQYSRGQIPQGVVVADEYHRRSSKDTDTINIEASGEAECGHVMPEPSEKTFPKIYADGIKTPEIDLMHYLLDSELIPESPYDSDFHSVMPEPPEKNFETVHIDHLATCLDIQTEQFYAPGYGQHDDIDLEGFRYPYRTDDLTLGGPIDDDTRIHFASDVSLTWDESINTLVLRNSAVGVAANLNIYGAYRVKSEGSSVSNYIQVYSTTLADRSILRLQKLHSDVEAAIETPDDSQLGEIQFWGVGTGSVGKQGATIFAIQDGAAAANYIPTELFFKTSDGTAAVASRLWIGKTGYIGFGEKIYMNSALGVQSDADAYIYFASDAYLFWDESEDHLISAKPFVLPVLADVYAGVINGSIWMEADGLHIFYNGVEKLVAGV